jgi:hypothetical protein
MTRLKSGMIWNSSFKPFRLCRILTISNVGNPLAGNPLAGNLCPVESETLSCIEDHHTPLHSVIF